MDCRTSISRSPSPNDFSRVNTSRYNTNINNPNYPASSSYRYNSRSPSPVLQFRPNNATTATNIGSSSHMRTANVTTQMTRVHHQLPPIPSAAEIASQASHHLRKLPPVPGGGGGGKSLPTPPTNKNIKDEQNDFELNDMSASSNSTINANQPSSVLNNLVVDMSGSGAGGQHRRKMPVITQPSKVNIIQKVPNVPSAGRPMVAQLTKQYASVGDDESDENENWF